ncbi:hypothetical protein FB567DRAFT_536298 [Paraphoma chrysanthemicola]|uniref:Uncharacterized protein n=1 Tax=Paraphoma chrysanthemicola TaxID=798071 RepID=A0A8K0QWC2_9PLEO|nr:hypothetical protein FB567DRAFT_536298 [Paraphoma chrysanthemicola]
MLLGNELSARSRDLIVCQVRQTIGTHNQPKSAQYKYIYMRCLYCPPSNPHFLVMSQSNFDFADDATYQRLLERARTDAAKYYKLRHEDQIEEQLNSLDVPCSPIATRFLACMLSMLVVDVCEKSSTMSTTSEDIKIYAQLASVQMDSVPDSGVHIVLRNDTTRIIVGEERADTKLAMAAFVKEAIESVQSYVDELVGAGNG